MALFALRHHLSANHGRDPETALNALLVRMRQRLYPETLPSLASCWLKTLCASDHNRVWWSQLKDRVDRALRDEPLDEVSRPVLMSARNWIERSDLVRSEAARAPHRVESQCRSIAPERLVPYVYRLLNEWLPAEVATLLIDDADGGESGEGIPALARARALNSLIVREHLSSETLDRLLDCALLSPRLVYPGDLEILHDVVLALSGRLSAPPFPALPAELLAVTGDSALPPDYASAVRGAFIEQAENGDDELHVPVADEVAREILLHDGARMGSVVVTMDGREWRPARLLYGGGHRIIYRAGERLRIDFTADHAKLTVTWPETISSWSGGLPSIAPLELFGREWRPASWEMNDHATLLHFTFSRILPIADFPPHTAAPDRLQPAYVEMAWTELERALADSVLRNNGDALERMRRAELIPLGRAFYGLAQCVSTDSTADADKIEQQVRAVRYHHAAVAETYGPVPWRILPERWRAKLANSRLGPETAPLLFEIFSDVPVTARANSGRPGDHSPPSSQAA